MWSLAAWGTTVPGLSSMLLPGLGGSYAGSTTHCAACPERDVSWGLPRMWPPPLLSARLGRLRAMQGQAQWSQRGYEMAGLSMTHPLQGLSQGLPLSKPELRL